MMTMMMVVVVVVVMVVDADGILIPWLFQNYAFHSVKEIPPRSRVPAWIFSGHDAQDNSYVIRVHHIMQREAT